MKALLDKDKIEEFMSELECLATYNTESITEEDYKDFLDKLKKDSISLNFKLPEFFKGARTKYSFRTNMQSYGGYAERRQQLKKQFDDALNIYEGYVFNANIKIDKKMIINLIKSSGSIKTKFGEIHNLEMIGEGANGIVYSGMMSNTKVAVKILANSDENKKNRFICEFCNIMLKINGEPNIAKVYFYDDIVLNNVITPAIIMKKYTNSLKYKPDITEEELIQYFKELLNALDIIHKNGMVHRDLKPQNLLIDDSNHLYVGDFGIAYYDPGIFEKTGHTQLSDRLANFNFSAPEQVDSKCDPHPSMDIYALGQIMQWLAYNKVHRGTNRKKIFEKYSTPRVKVLDNIIERCLDNEPEERYQSVDEIKQEIDKYNRSVNVPSKEILEMLKNINRVEVSYWKEVIEFFKSNGKIVLYTNLIQTSAYEINDKILEIQFENKFTDFGKMILNKEENIDTIRKAVFKFSGKDLEIKYTEKIMEKKLII